MIPTQKKLRYGSKKALKFRGASLLKIVAVEYSEDAGCPGGSRVDVLVANMRKSYCAHM